ncbi:MAG: terminase family protein [Proteobacteria bacterium]|nr:terminase family protein [Pseudomonadota bacterium]
MATKKPTREWVAQPRQQRFLWEVVDPEGADEILYGGAAGGGKTDALLIACILYCQQFGVNSLFLRKTFPQLEGKPIPRSKELISKAAATYSETKHKWVFKKTGAVLQFGSLDKSGDEEDYQGHEYGLIAWDELTHFPIQPYDYLLSRNRNIKGGVKSKVVAATNPGGRGHSWCKSRWKIGVMPPEKGWLAEPTPAQAMAGVPTRKRMFIPARVEDNQILMDADPFYKANLLGLPDQLKRALYDGDWDVFAGMAFSEWRNYPNPDNKFTHVIKPFEIPANWERFTTLDWGYSKPFSVGWWAIDFDGRIYRYREWYGASEPDVGLKMDPVEVAVGILEREAGEPKPRWRVGDPAIWAKPQVGGPSVGEFFQGKGIFWRKGRNNRIQGKMQVHHRLKFDEEGYPGLYVFDTCQEFIRTFPELILDDRNPEDIDTTQEDHSFDEMRYGLMERLYKTERFESRILTDLPPDLMKDLNEDPRALQHYLETLKAGV